MVYAKYLKNGAQGLTRTADTRIFSPPRHNPQSPKTPRFLRHRASEKAENAGTNGAFRPHKCRHSLAAPVSGVRGRVKSRLSVRFPTSKICTVPPAFVAARDVTTEFERAFNVKNLCSVLLAQ